MFLSAYAPIFHRAACETVNHLLSGGEFDKSKWNTHLQSVHGISKRHANGVISFTKGVFDAAKEARKLHIKTLEGKIKSCEQWIKKAEKNLKNAFKFYNKKNWDQSKSGGVFPLSCSLEFRNTNWQHLRFQVHNKKRKLFVYKNKLIYIKDAPLRVVIPRNQAFVVGSKDESFGNQVCQWDGTTIKVRVPGCLESRFGKHVSSRIGDFPRNIDRLLPSGAKSWHFYRKNSKWVVAVQFTPKPVERVSRHFSYGCIGIDLNPGSVGWAYVDSDGNLKAKGQIPLQMRLPAGKQNAQIVDACLQLATLATTYACQVICEELDFTEKKSN